MKLAESGPRLTALFKRISESETTRRLGKFFAGVAKAVAIPLAEAGYTALTKRPLNRTERFVFDTAAAQWRLVF